MSLPTNTSPLSPSAVALVRRALASDVHAFASLLGVAGTDVEAWEAGDEPCPPAPATVLHRLGRWNADSLLSLRKTLQALNGLPSVKEGVLLRLFNAEPDPAPDAESEVERQAR